MTHIFSYAEFTDDSEKYYERLVAGKMLEMRVCLAILAYAVERNANKLLKPARISLYEPQVDKDAVDVIVRTETPKWVSFEELQIKTARNGLQVSDFMLRLADLYKARQQRFVLICSICPETMTSIKDTRCFFSSEISGLVGSGHHIPGSLIEQQFSYDVFLEDRIEAVP